MTTKYLSTFDIAVDAFDRLPRTCLAITPGGKKVQLKRGHAGNYPVHPATNIDKFNEERGITEFQTEAMLVGSMFGWHVPAADPANQQEWAEEATKSE